MSLIDQVSFSDYFQKPNYFKVQHCSQIVNDFFSLVPARNKLNFNVLVQPQSLPKVSFTSHAQCITAQFLTLAQMFKYLILVY